MKLSATNLGDFQESLPPFCKGGTGKFISGIHLKLSRLWSSKESIISIVAEMSEIIDRIKNL